MPLYDYICDVCGRKSSFLTRSISSPLEPVCGSCGSTRMRQAVSRFAIGKTVRQVHEQTGPMPRYSDSSHYEDPRNIGRNVEAAFDRYGMDLPGEIRESIDAAREGTPPEGLDF